MVINIFQRNQTATPLRVAEDPWAFPPSKTSVPPAFADALDVGFDVRISLDVEANGRAVYEKLAVVLHRVVVAVDPRRNGLRDADADKGVARVGIFDMQNLVGLESKYLVVVAYYKHCLKDSFVDPCFGKQNK